MKTVQQQSTAKSIQQRAQQIIEWKKRSRVLPEAEPAGNSLLPSSCLLQGAEHLKKLDLVPQEFGTLQTSEEVQQVPDSKLKNPLLCRPNFSFDVELPNKDVKDCNCNSNIKNVKSGKYAKSSVNIKKQEVWPHTAVSQKICETG